MAYQDIEFEISDPYATITLNRPEKLNAFTFETLEEIHDAVARAARSKHVVGIIIAANGRGFCAGLDANALQAATSGGPTMARYQAEEEYPGLFSYFLKTPKPIIAAVNGVAAGGGLVMCLMADVRIASESASFTTVFLKRGLIAEHGSSWLLPRLVGLGRTMDLMFTGERIDAATALSYGLVQKLVKDDELTSYAKNYVKSIASSTAPASIAETKRLIYRHMGLSFTDALHEAETIQNRFVSRTDALEGAQALIEKRSAKFERIGE